MGWVGSGAPSKAVSSSQAAKWAFGLAPGAEVASVTQIREYFAYLI